MDPFQDTRQFLTTVRRKLIFRAVASTSITAGIGLLSLAIIAPFLSAWLDARHASTLKLGLVLSLFLTAVIGFAVVYWFQRRVHSDEAVARFVGRKLPSLASDLLSSVQLERESLEHPRFSQELAAALAADVARKVRGVDLRQLIPSRGIRVLSRVLLGMSGGYLVLVFLAPPPFERGWHRILAARLRADPHAAVAVLEPILGDIKMTLHYPPHSRREPLVIPVSSGDIVALRGTQVTLETIALRQAAKARLELDEQAGGRMLPMAVEGRRLKATFRVDKAGGYRIRLDPALGNPVVEAEHHRIDIEPDRAPRVDLRAPADELEVSSRRQVELAYGVEDDFGLSEIALAWRGASGNEERKVLPAPKPGARSVQGTLLWDLSEVPLEPGARVAYRIEAKDNDTLFGPNVGSSRTYYLRVYSPRERHEEIMARQQALLEDAISLLGDRLELPKPDVEPHRATFHRAEKLVSDLASLLPLLAEDPLLPKQLKPQLAGTSSPLEAMHGRLAKLVGDEQVALSRIDRAGSSSRGSLGPLHELCPRHVAEMEKDVLLLDDWLERQKLEEILAISDEIRHHREKLKELLDELKRSGSAKARAEIEREMRALEKEIAHLRAKLASLGGETEDRFVNSEALEAQNASDCMAKVRALFDQGDIAAASAELERCGRMWEKQAQALENGLQGMRGEKFSEEEKAYSELMDELSDLEKDENDIAAESSQVLDRYMERAAQVARDQGNPAREKAKLALERLREELSQVPRDGLTPFGQEEHDAVARRLVDVGRMLDDGDLAEALAMARQAEQGLRTLEAEIEDDLHDGEPWSARTDEALDHVDKAKPLLQELIHELESATPSPDTIMSPSDKRALDELRRRQQSVRERARRLLQKVQKRGKELPGQSAETAEKGLEEASERMQRAEQRLGAKDALGGREEARGAAEQLESLRKGMQRSARPSSVQSGGRSPDEEPVRIPGSEEFRPSQEFREDILEAKKKAKAPEAYRELVKRYYEELVK